MVTKTSVLFVITWLFGVLVTESNATTCTPLTQNTCAESLLMTGVCTDEVCECRHPDVYEPGPFGCQVTQEAYVVEDGDGLMYKMETGASQRLMCAPRDAHDGILWYLDGALVDDGDAYQFMYTVQLDHAGTYEIACKSTIGGTLSPMSDVITLSVEDNPTPTPAITKMPETGVLGMKVHLSFPPTVKYQTDDALTNWTFGGSSTGTTDRNFEHVVQPGDEGKQIFVTEGGVQSPAVAFPDSFDSDILGVEIIAVSGLSFLEEGEDPVELFCEITGAEDRNNYNDIVAYSWYKDEEPIDDDDWRLFLIRWNPYFGAGSYTCQAKVGENPPKISPPAIVTVKNTVGEVQVIASAEGFLRNGYFSLTCDFKTVNTRSPVTYTWRKDSALMLGVTDKTLQFNSCTVGNSWHISCSVNGEDGTLSSKRLTVKLDIASQISGDTPSISSNVDAYGIGNHATFTCKIKYFTPGAVFIWTVDNEVQEGQESQKFTYAPTSPDRVVIKCGYTFDDVLSPETTETINPKYLMSTSLHNDHGYLSSTLLTPVTSTDVNLHCAVTLSLSAGDADDVTYQWLKDDENIEGATSQDYVITADVGASATIKCAATVNGDTTTSDGVTLTTQDTAAKPIVSLLGARPSLGSDVSLYCVSQSDADGATFEWKKDADVIPGATDHFYQIKSLQASNNGNYSCNITVGGEISAESETFNLETLNQCKWASDCTEEGMDITICDEGMCRCVPGLIMESFQCVHVTPQIFIGDLPSPSTLNPVALTSVKLSCHTPGLGDDVTVTFQWTEGGREVGGSTSRDHVHQAGDVGTSVIITCTATTSAGTVTSAEVTVIAQDEAAKPYVSDGDTTPFVRREMSMSCVSTSVAEGASYTWRKDFQVIAGVTTHVYQIPSVQASDVGKYTCTISVGGSTSEESEDLLLDTIYMCQTASDCDQDNMDTAACEDGVCRCLLGFSMVNFLCAGSSSLMAGVVMVILSAALATTTLL